MGISLIDTPCEIYENSIFDNPIGISIHPDSSATSQETMIHHNRFFNNTDFGVKADWNKNRENIRNNWWGDDSGPGGAGPGSGDRISEHADFDPWLRENEEYESNKEDQETMILPVIALGIGLCGITGLALLREDVRIGLLTITLLPLYSRLRKDELLGNDNRNIIYQHILGHPGVHYSSLLREMSFGSGTLVHHLALLERNGMIRTKKKFSRRFFFPSGMPIESPEKPIERPLSHNQSTILEFLKVRSSATSREIQEGSSLSQSSVNYSLDQLVKDGIVVRSKEETGKRIIGYRLRED